MKKFVILIGALILVAILIISLIYFVSRSSSTDEKALSGPNPTEEYQKYISDTTVTRIFRGILPCADCAGIETVISLSHEKENNESGNFTLATTYLGTDRDSQLISGDWLIQQVIGQETNLLILNYTDGTIETYKWLDNETLVKQDIDGSDFENEQEYTIKLQ